MEAAGKVPVKEDLADEIDQELDDLLNETTKSYVKASTSAEHDKITGSDENVVETFCEKSECDTIDDKIDDDLIKLCESVENEDNNKSLIENDKSNDLVEKILETSENNELEKDKSCETSDKVDDSSSKSESNLVIDEPFADSLESAEDPKDKIESENETKSSNDQIVEIAEMMETSGIASGDDDEPMVVDEDDTSRITDGSKPVETSSAIAETALKGASEDGKYFVFPFL